MNPHSLAASQQPTPPHNHTRYDAEGRRVRRTVPGSGITDDYLYDLSGHYITQVSGTGWWIRGELYAGERHLGTYENDLSTPTTFFNHSDWLGTERVQTAVNGTACETIVSLPFGDGLTTSGSCDPSAEYFTGKELDWESNLDNFGMRYYSSQFGRFLSADPDNAGASEDDPQSWNGYSYVRNSALNATDPHGLDCIYLNAGGTAVDHVLNFQTTGIVNPDCTSDTDSGYYVNGTVDVNSISFGGGYMAYQYIPAGGAAPQLGGACVDTCADTSVTVHASADFNAPIMTASPGFIIPPTTIGPNLDWFYSKQAGCSVQGLESAGKDMIMYDEFNAIADSLASGSLSPLKNLFSGGAALDAAGTVAGHVASSRSAQLGIKHTLATLGIKKTGAAVSRGAARVGKSVEVAGWMLSAYDAYKGYSSCMQQ